jgi:prepilin-type processing-associated H-X9-DG protein
MAVVLGLKEPQKFSQGVDRLMDYANKKLAASPSGKSGMPMSIQHSKVGDVDVSYLAGMMMFSPSFAVKGQHAFVAISPVALNGAIAQSEQPQSSLLDNVDYQSARAKLPGKVVAVTYEDTRELAASAYAMITMVGPMLAGRADAPFDLALLPPLAKVQEKLFGGVGVVSIDGGDLVGRQYSAVGLNLTSFAGSSGFMAALALPALGQAREKARIANCTSNLKQIGLACRMYADTHDGKFPGNLDELVDPYLHSPKILHCPSAASNEGTSYVYIRGLTVNDGGKVLAYDADGNHRNGGKNVLFCDGHVTWMADREFRFLLQKQM